MRVLLVDGFDTRDSIVDIANEALAAHDVSRLRLVDEGFDRFMSPAERRAYHEVDNLITPEQRRSATLVRSHQAILVCGPVIEGAISPSVKSWFERVFIPEVAFTFTKAGRVTAALDHVRRVGMIALSPDDDRSAHRRNGSTRSAVRGLRLSSSRGCRTTYVALGPNDEASRKITKALRHW